MKLVVLVTKSFPWIKHAFHLSISITHPEVLDDKALFLSFTDRANAPLHIKSSVGIVFETFFIIRNKCLWNCSGKVINFYP